MTNIKALLANEHLKQLQITQICESYTKPNRECWVIKQRNYKGKNK